MRRRRRRLLRGRIGTRVGRRWRWILILQFELSHDGDERSRSEYRRRCDHDYRSWMLIGQHLLLCGLLFGRYGMHSLRSWHVLYDFWRVER
jgi:hypothetical protein